jgi:hypothetical protein
MVSGENLLLLLFWSSGFYGLWVCERLPILQKAVMTNLISSQTDFSHQNRIGQQKIIMA